MTLFHIVCFEIDYYCSVISAVQNWSQVSAKEWMMPGTLHHTRTSELRLVMNFRLRIRLDDCFHCWREASPSTAFAAMPLPLSPHNAAAASYVVQMHSLIDTGIHAHGP
eukprot:GHVU01091779.1.p1 GENE.GHVU01091779.1~~GHVU01091779.1.p1  ORF type:complete len:109 (+),score=5.19 GHVU01091779.1:260-586(+)